jgi:Kef-type K+ transport system membrane component KefB
MMRRMVFGFGMVSTMINCRDAGSDTAISIAQGLLPAAITPALVAQFSLFVAIVLLWVLALGKLGKVFLHMPTIATQIIAGMLLGPSGLNIACWSLFATPIYLADTLSAHTYALSSTDLFLVVIMFISSAWTVAYLLWIAGHETDIQDIYQIGLIAVTAGFFGAVFPIVMTVAGIYPLMPIGWTWLQVVGIGLAFAATSVSIPVAMLVANDKMHLKSSKATLGAAIVDDILAVILLSLYFIVADTGFFGATTISPVGHGHGSMFISLLFMAIAFICMAIVGKWVMPAMIHWLERHHYTHLIAPSAQIFMQLYFAFAELVGGIAGITGAYFAGLFHKKSDHTHHAESVFSPYVQVVLLPLFLGSIGLQIDVTILSLRHWGIVLLLLAIAIISKLLACWLSTALSNWYGGRTTYVWTGLETYLFGSAMVARGEVGLVIASVLYSAKIVTAEQYVISIVVIVLSTVAAPIMLAIGFHFLTLTQVLADEYTVNLGLFQVVGTQQMFAIIISALEAVGTFKTSIDISEGRKVVNIEGQHVEIILSPEEGIILKGNREKISQLMRSIKNGMNHDLAQLRVR